MQESKLFSFLDKKNSFTLHFLEGQKTIHDMAIMHQLSGSGFAYYRDILLSTIPLIYLLKKEESFGFYLDSENPFFRFKLEVSYLGNYRTLMLPDNFNQFPEKLSGQLRFSKIVSNMNPYTTIMEIKDQSFTQAINQLLHDSYQIESSLHVSDISDQSLIISKIPREDVGRIIVEPTMPIKDYINKMGNDFFSIFSEAFSDEQKIIDWFSAKDLLFLGAKNFKFHCPCSKDRMMTNLSVLTDEDLLHIFEEKNKLEITCDYCHKIYNFDRDEIKKVHLKN